MHGKREQVLLENVEVSLRAPILKAYLRHAPGARPHLGISQAAPLSEFEKIAAKVSRISDKINPITALEIVPKGEIKTIDRCINLRDNFLERYFASTHVNYRR